VSGFSSGVTQIAAGANNGYALRSDGSAWAWGVNNYGQIGDNTGATNHLVPAQVSGLTSGVTQIAAGSGTGYALRSDGSVKAWGLNNAGQVGDSTKANRLAPVTVLVPTGHNVQKLGENSPASTTALLVMTTP
jgi:alpha-tubulin suppressor-like RCC1 family protein